MGGAPGGRPPPPGRPRPEAGKVRGSRPVPAEKQPSSESHEAAGSGGVESPAPQVEGDAVAEKRPEDEGTTSTAGSERVRQDRVRKSEEEAFSAKASAEAIKLLNPLRAQVEIEVCVLGAEELPRLQKHKGCDPYVKLTSIDEHNNAETIGEYSVKKSTTRPRWDEESFSVVVPVESTGPHDYRLRLEVFDHDRVGKKQVALGQVVMKKDELLTPRLGAFRKPLQPHDTMTKIVGKKVTGTLELRLHVYARVVVAIDRATQLRAADVSGTSDPYALCRWAGHKARRLGRTQTIQTTLSPTWNHPLVVLIPILRPFHGGRLEIDVFDDDWMGRDDFLGRATMDGEFILRQRTPDPIRLPLKGRHPRERAQGSIEVRVFVHRALYSFVRDVVHDVTHKTKTLNEIPRVHANLTVLRATGLRRADCCGFLSGDPYAVVYSGGCKLGRTPTRRKTTCPTWDNKNTFKLKNLPTKLPPKQTDGELPPRGSIDRSTRGDDDDDGDDGAAQRRNSWTNAFRQQRDDDEKSYDSNETDEPDTPPTPTPGDDDDQRLEPSGGKKKSAEDERLDAEQTEVMPGEHDAIAVALSVREAQLQAERSGEPFVDVRLDLFDDDPVSRDFLGTAAVSWRQLVTPGEHELALADRPHQLRRRKGRFAIRGTVTVRVELEAVVAVVINEGVGLAQNDPYDKSDPYAIAKWGLGAPVAKTLVRDDNLDPKWYGPAFELSVPIPTRVNDGTHKTRSRLEDDPDRDELRIEVWEKDKWTSDDFMGLVSVPADELLHPSPALPRFLARRPGKSEDPAPQGYLELDIRASYVPFGVLEPRSAKKIDFKPEGRSGDDQPEVELCVRILRAGGLIRQDLLGGADPFAQIRLNGRLVGKTATRRDTLNPVWKNEAFYFTLPLNAAGDVAKKDTEVRLEVWNAGFTTKQFMGVARIRPIHLLNPSGITRYALLPEKPSAAYLAAPESVDPGLGWIEIDVKVSAQITIEILKADGLRAADSSGTSDPYVVVRWAGPNARKVARCAAEKRTLSPKWWFMLPLSVPMAQPDNMFAAVVLEVWDHDLVGSHDFLGLSVIDPHELLASANSTNAAPQTRRLLNRDKNGREKNEAKGTITFKVNASQPVLRLRQKLVDIVRQQKTANVLDGA